MNKKNILLAHPLFAIVMGFVLVLTNSCEKKVEIHAVVTDIEGNVYRTLAIGKQVWMVENLKTTKYNDGTSIPLVTGNPYWSDLTTPGYCWYYNDAAYYKDSYGALYNWFTINTGKLCPTGWHVPTDAEWTVLTDNLGGEDLAGGKLKESGTTHWITPNVGATNKSGFKALPGGYHASDGSFYDSRFYGYFWSASESGNYSAYFRLMYHFFSSVQRNYFTKQNGLSVRCISDEN